MDSLENNNGFGRRELPSGVLKCSSGTCKNYINEDLSLSGKIIYKWDIFQQTIFDCRRLLNWW